MEFPLKGESGFKGCLACSEKPGINTFIGARKMNPTLRRGDGFRDTTPARRVAVERLQRSLKRLGYDTDVDGLFGPGTERAVKRFQKDRNLFVDGIAGPATWRALKPRGTRGRARAVAGMEKFRGDLSWVHAREGHSGRPYWPGGSSGVTLDPGFDLGHQTLKKTRELYKTRITDNQYRAVARVTGIRGAEAKPASRGPAIQSIRISRSAALRVMPHIAVSYWQGIVRRFPALDNLATPPSVQTALLSLAYNRGVGNSGLKLLGVSIKKSQWLKVASAIGKMQQTHKLQGIRIRRRQEADLIREEVGFG
jgi:hypothetical protein